MKGYSGIILSLALCAPAVAQGTLVCGSSACPALINDSSKITGLANVRVGGHLYDVSFSTTTLSSPFPFSDYAAGPGQPPTAIDAANALEDVFAEYEWSDGEYGNADLGENFVIATSTIEKGELEGDPQAITLVPSFNGGIIPPPVVIAPVGPGIGGTVSDFQNPPLPCANMYCTMWTEVTYSLSGTTIPSATQIVDMNLNVWTLSGGVAYVNGKPSPSGGVILLLCYGGVVYQENIHHDWWLWDTNTWVASVDPRVISPSGTSIPVATQIIDSELDVWTLSDGRAYEHGQLTPSSGVILLLYADGIIYQENIHHDWWYWRNGAWVATSAPLPPSASGTAIPTATQIVDNARNVWTLSGGKAYENHELTPSSGVILLLFYGGTVFQENVHHDWWEWSGKAWISRASDPRAGQPLAYVASTTGGTQSVTVIDTGTNLVKATIPIGFEAAYIVATSDAKQVYVAGASYNVAVIDTAQESLLTTILVPDLPLGIVASPADGTRVYLLSLVSSSGCTNSSVLTLDLATNVLMPPTTYTPGYDDVGITISPDGKTLYLPSSISRGCGSSVSAAFIDVIETASNSLVNQLFLPTSSYSSNEKISNTVISPNNAKLYSNHSYTDVDNNDVNEVAILNPETGAETKRIPAVLTVQVFSPDSLHLYGVGLGGVGVIDTTTDVSTTAVANILGVSSLAITPDGKHLYITDASTNSVLVADTATYTISTVIPVSLAGTGAIAIVSAH